ncbi:MAG: 3-hydroxyacyl-ACP dehydratase FabZ family protein [Chthoniobacter sp.]|uniref:3-hydroxyacyl-ACP dehydratase FabZ family protein n=1 Tax=Chthoniobacter sp. TaxID=2510640 RepID=UPI0032AE14E9
MSASDPIAYGLPHREPFVFVGSVVEVQPGESAVCEKSFPPEEPFFRGHFPGDPLVPGVIITEALAQTAGIAAGQPGRGFRLTAIKGMKFLRAVRPRDVLRFHARKIAAVGGLWQFEVTARVGEDTVADGVVVLSEV